jgi:hypothetical protein
LWTGVVLAVAAVIGGGLLAWHGYTRTSSAAAAVRAYFAALQRDDAAAALGYGTVPPGPHVLLTSEALKEQQAIAPIRSVRVISSRTRNGTGSVEVEYTIAFPNSPQSVRDTIAVVRRDGAWRLRASAVSTSLVMATAHNRASIAGKAVPDGEVLVFPGALPIRFDSPYLQLDPVQDYVSFGTGQVVSVAVDITRAARDAVVAALASALRSCLTSQHPDPTCPLPDDRYVPGSIRAPLPSNIGDNLVIDLRSSPSGLLAISGAVTVKATYRRLTYANIAVAGKGSVQLAISATAYAVKPLHLKWTPS